jgi:hypothetical protein
MVINGSCLGIISSLPLCVRPSALFQIGINFETIDSYLWGFLEQDIDGLSRSLYAGQGNDREKQTAVPRLSFERTIAVSERCYALSCADVWWA